jgi:hypothetical protein
MYDVKPSWFQVFLGVITSQDGEWRVLTEVPAGPPCCWARTEARWPQWRRLASEQAREELEALTQGWEVGAEHGVSECTAIGLDDWEMEFLFPTVGTSRMGLFRGGVQRIQRLVQALLSLRHLVGPLTF